MRQAIITLGRENHAAVWTRIVYPTDSARQLTAHTFGVIAEWCHRLSLETPK